MTSHTTNLSGAAHEAAWDARLDQRPGIPMELDPPRPMGAAHWTEPERQPDPGYVLKRKELDRLTPVFGTAGPPRGISGALRKLAYRIPEHHTKRWIILLFADRVDVFEHGDRRKWALAVPVAVGGIAAIVAASRAMPRRRRRAWLR